MTRLILIPFLVLFCLSPLAAAQESALASCPCTLRGTVIDSVTNQPIRSALVKVTGIASGSTLTDSEGRFEFNSVPAGTISIAAQKPGYPNAMTGLYEPLFLQFDQNSETPVIKLTPLGILYGHVQNELGDPIEGLTVQVLLRNPLNRSFFGGSRKPVGFTDDQGNYRIPDLTGGLSYYVSIQKDSPLGTIPSRVNIEESYPSLLYPGVPDLSSATPLKVAAGSSVRADFTLKAEPMIRLSGSLVGPSSFVDASIAIESLAAPSSRGNSILVDRRTGAFLSDWIPQGSYVLHAAVPVPGKENSSARARLTVNARTSLSDLRLVLQPTTPILVNVHGISLTDNESLRIALESADPNQSGHPLFPILSSPQTSGGLVTQQMEFLFVQPGAYFVETFNLPNTRYYIDSISSGTADLLHNNLVVNPSGSVPSIEVSMREGAAKLSGKLASTPPSGIAVVLLWNPSIRSRPFVEQTNLSGSFQFVGLPPATYKFFAVDGSGKFDLSDPDALRRFASGAREISLAPGQSVTATAELSAVPD